MKIGFKLFNAMVDYSRESNKKTIPLCPFAKTQFDKNDQYKDVLLP